MARLRGRDIFLLDGIPELCRVVLDELAADGAIPAVQGAIRHYVQRHLSDPLLLERLKCACVNCLAGTSSIKAALSGVTGHELAQALERLLRHRQIQFFLATEQIVADLENGVDCGYLTQRLPANVIDWVGHAIHGQARPLEHLHTLLRGRPAKHAMVASLLCRADPSWVPVSKPPPRLAGAYLEDAAWRGACLAGADMAESDLSGADLCDAELSRANVSRARLRRARVSGAKLLHLRAKNCQAAFADMSSVQAYRAVFEQTNLSRANFSNACLQGVAFTGAVLNGASFRNADLRQAQLTGTAVEEADFTNADLDGADLSNLDLRTATLRGARFARANLVKSNFEYMELPNADFNGANLFGALLTGTTMPNGSFRGASLQEAGLADIEWEGAILCGADLRGASFHLGSSRSGRVYSPIACEGSRTGFYTDDYDELYFKAPEEIRKANLCRADLRGANVTNVDFYLVDLRGALYDRDQAEHFRRCGAILEARV